MGIRPRALEPNFEPFFKFKTETAGKGTGLGLSMLFGFTERWGGHINVLHRVGERTTFRLYRRRRAEEIAVRLALIALETVEGGSESVLLVEEAARRAASARSARLCAEQIRLLRRSKAPRASGSTYGSAIS